MHVSTCESHRRASPSEALEISPWISDVTPGWFSVGLVAVRREVFLVFSRCFWSEAACVGCLAEAGVAPGQADPTATVVSLPAAFVLQWASLAAFIFPSLHRHKQRDSATLSARRKAGTRHTSLFLLRSHTATCPFSSFWSSQISPISVSQHCPFTPMTKMDITLLFYSSIDFYIFLTRLSQHLLV